MKRVITFFTISLMTLLMGCSFSKQNSDSNLLENQTPEKKVEEYNLGLVTDIESAIKYLPADNIRPYFKEIPTAKLNTPFLNGKNAIEVALERGNESVLRDLLDLGVSPFIKNTISKKSAYELGITQEYYAQRSDLRNFMTFPNLLQAARLKYRKKMKTFLDKKMFNEFLLEIEEKHLPCEELISDIIDSLNRSKKMQIPNDVIQKLLNTASCKDNFSQKRVKKYFELEFKNQIKRGFSSLLILEYLSRKFPQQIFYLNLNTDVNKSIVINPAALIMWGIQGKSYPKLSEKLSQIYLLANFPAQSAVMVTKSNQIDPTETDSKMNLEELLKTQDPELLEALKMTYGFYEGVLEDQAEAGVLE